MRGKREYWDGPHLKKLRYLMVKHTYIFFVVTAIILSDLVLLSSVKSSYFISESIPIEVYGLSTMVGSQLMNNLDITIN